MRESFNASDRSQRYYDEPDALDPHPATEAIATRCAAACAASVVVYGRYHLGIWDESTRSVTNTLLRIAQEEGGVIIHTGVKNLPEPGPFLTWRRSDAEPGERRAWFEVRLEDPSDE